MPALTRLAVQGFRFAAVGLLNTLIGLSAIYFFMFFFRLKPEYANCLGYLIGLSVSYWLNRTWSFESRDSIGKSLSLYGATALVCFSANLLVVSLSIHHWGVNRYLAQLFGSALYSLLMFILCRVLIFKQPQGSTAVTSWSFLMKFNKADVLAAAFWLACIIVVPLLLGYKALGLGHNSLAVPLDYRPIDPVWQLMLTKTLLDTGWVLNNPYLGAPGIATLYANSAAQTSALHSVLMLGLSLFIHEPVKLQQVYFLINFPLICFTSFMACKLLRLGNMVSFCVGLIFAFTTARFDQLCYSFLPNYFMVPLAIVAVIWVASGRFNIPERQARFLELDFKGLIPILLSRDFLLGLGFIIALTLSDGYYSFFTLLSLAFAGGVQFIKGQWRRPASMVPVIIYCVVLVAASWSLQAPLRAYEASHLSEFYPNGVKDSSLYKQPFEAEVYSTNLTLLVAPTASRFQYVRHIGTYMVQVSDEAMKFASAPTGVGCLCTVLFVIAFALICVPSLRPAMTRTSLISSSGNQQNDGTDLLDAILALVLFVYMTCTFGGIGQLVAFVFPTIRAYSRFELFLIFLLLVGAALVFDSRYKAAHLRTKFIAIFLLILTTVFTVANQIPVNSGDSRAAVAAQFTAEKQFIDHIESVLPKGAMVFQYPYGQYLFNSPYYGWGSFGGVRLYLQSHTIHWSNGGAKNSPADNWDSATSDFPPAIMATEAQAAGFSAIVVDGTVLSQAQIQAVVSGYESRGGSPWADSQANLVFVQLPDAGYRLIYTPKFDQVSGVLITNPAVFEKQRFFSRTIAGPMLADFVSSHQIKPGTVIESAQYPQFFFSADELNRGNGSTPITPITDMKGSLQCNIVNRLSSGVINVNLVLKNDSSFDWELGSGGMPFRIGRHLFDTNGKLVTFDDGFRLAPPDYVSLGMSDTIPVQLNAASMSSIGTIRFALVQEGIEWFDNVACNVALH